MAEYFVRENPGSPVHRLGNVHEEVALDQLIEARSELAEACRVSRDLQARLGAVLGTDVEGYDALMHRMAETARLLDELNRWLEANPSVRELLPNGYAVRLRAQLHAAGLRTPAPPGGGIRAGETDLRVGQFTPVAETDEKLRIRAALWND